MKRVYHLFTLVFVISSLSTYGQIRVVGYLPMWGDFQGAINETDFSLYTHINLSFTNPSNGKAPTVAIDASNKSLISSAVPSAHSEGTNILLSFCWGFQ